MSDKHIVEMPESINNAIKNISDLPTKNVGQTLSDCWFLIFGGVSQLAEKRKLKYAKELESFKSSLEEKIASIPEQNRLNANTQIVMPALDSAKYCVEETVLREMFANLISCSIDNRKNSLVHPSFCDILKSLTPLDVKNLLLIDHNILLPICNIIHYDSEQQSHFNLTLQNLFFMNPECQVYEQQSLSIGSLLRHGLVEIPATQSISDPTAYTVYENCDELIQIKNEYPNEKFGLQKNLIRLTPFGCSFMDVCCPD